MTWTPYTFKANSPTTQLPKHRASELYRPCWCKLHKLPRAVAAQHTAHAFHIPEAQGRTQDQCYGVCCHSSQSQHAGLQQQGPNISRLGPALQQQWDHAANAHLGPVDITPKNGRKVWWRCDQCPDGHLHRWEATVANRSNGRGCPQCCGRKVCKHNALATIAPLMAAQWDYVENDSTPDSVVAESNQKVGWLCEVCGHKWNATPNYRVQKRSGCPQCANADAKGRKKIKHPTFAECKDSEVRALLAQWDHPRNAEHGHFPDKVTLQSDKQIFWLCTNCPARQQHSWPAQPRQRTAGSKTGCPFWLLANATPCRCFTLT